MDARQVADQCGRVRVAWAERRTGIDIGRRREFDADGDQSTQAASMVGTAISLTISSITLSVVTLRSRLSGRTIKR